MNWRIPETEKRVSEHIVISDLEETGRFDQDEKKKRKVRLTKVSGKRTGNSQLSVVGVEELPPKAGREYRVFTDQGTLFRTTSVIQIVPRYIQTEESGVLGVLISTQNAVYEIEVIEER